MPSDLNLRTNLTLSDAEAFFQPGSLKIHREKNGRGTCQFRIRALKAQPYVGQVVGVYDRGTQIFGGTIHDIKLSPIVAVGGSEAWYDVLATDWTHFLERHFITAAFSNMAAGEIVLAILGATAEIPPQDVQLGASAAELGVVIFRGVTAADAIEELAKRSRDFVWYVDVRGYLYFTPRQYVYATHPIDAASANYREPEVRIDRTDYYNRISIAIAYDAFDPFTLNIPGDQTYPTFDLYDPSDPLQAPVPVDVIRAIKLNGVEQDFGPKVLDPITGAITDPHTLYYTPGLSTVEWDPSQPQPSSADVVTYEFYKVGSNIVTVDDLYEIMATAAAEGGAGTGIYHAFIEDLDIHDQAVARLRCDQFLDQHAPGRTIGHAPGDMPTTYSWATDSIHLWDGINVWVNDLMPGTVVNFTPSTPTSQPVQVIVDTIDIEHLESRNPECFRYHVNAIDTASQSGSETEFYRALAELSPLQTGVKDFPDLGMGRRTITFGIPSPSVTSDVGWYVEISIPVGQVFRCEAAWLSAHTAPTGADLLIDCSYSTDGGTTWNNVFQSANGDLSLSAGSNQRSTPLGQFSGFPSALDIPSAALVRCAVVQTGSAANVLVQIVGEVRKAVPVTTTP